ncbi:putative protein kinase RLK-Pelle-LRR-IX family [Helianthus debilis subsp. tardiflorus]
MEYIHTLAHQSFIQQDLKSSNILLGDDFRAKVSDLGLVKLFPDGGKSIMTRVAGTLRYVAPEYAGNYHFSSYIYVWIHTYIYIYIYISIGRSSCENHPYCENLENLENQCEHNLK